MEVFPILVGISLVVVGLVVWIYFRMSSSGQFDDLDSPAQRILLDDDQGVIASKQAPDDDSGKPK
jgi:cbb3-type cytochrome oxidase maturation protein